LRTIVTSSRFRKDFKAFKNDKFVKEALKEVIPYLQQDELLPVKFKDHALIGEYLGCRDCHLLNDVVLIYECSVEEVILIRIGNHSKLFG